MTDTKELRIKRAGLIKEARTILDKADKEKRSTTAEDDAQYDKIWAECETLRTEIEKLERRNDVEREETALQMREEDERRKREDDDKDLEITGGPRSTPEYRTAFRKWIAARRLDQTEQRALSAGTATEGGYFYADEKFSDELIVALADATIVRAMATVIGLPTADSLGVPTLTDMSDAEWTSELGAASRDTTMAFGKRALTPHPLAKEIPVSKTLIRKVAKIVSLVQNQLANAVGRATENAYMTGDGVQKALGMFTASDDGISTSRDVSTGNTTTSPTFDGLKAAKYELEEPYWARAVWVFHRDIMELIAKLKDGNGRYMLQDSVIAGEPDRMLNFPVRMSEYAASTPTTGLYVGILGDLSYYWIVDAMDIQIARAEELLIRSNQDLFVIRMETDGAPVLEEAFVRVKLA